MAIKEGETLSRPLTRFQKNSNNLERDPKQAAGHLEVVIADQLMPGDVLARQRRHQQVKQTGGDIIVSAQDRVQVVG